MKKRIETIQEVDGKTIRSGWKKPMYIINNMNHLHSLVLAISLLVGGMSVVTAQTYEQDMAEGAAALQNGDYITAIEKFGFWGMIESDATAQGMLGAIAADGYGDLSNPDYATAIKYYTLAANQNLAASQLMLGEMYRDGKGVTKDYTEAVKWFRLAAEQGLSDAQDNLGVMYHKGQGVPQDDTEAFRWWKMSAIQGNLQAQSDIGIMYETGRGVPQNNMMAYMWYDIASANGHDEASAYRDQRAGLMSQEDISKSQKMASECMSSNYKNCGY